MVGDFFAPELLDLASLVERRAVRQAVRRLIAYVAQESIDVIHLPSTLRFAVGRRLAARVPTVSTAHVVSCTNRTRRVRRGSAAIVVPSLWPEVYGMVGAEALALGVPVVGFGIGGSAEWLALGGSLATTVDALDVAALARALTRVVADPPSDAERRAVATAVRRSLSSNRHGERLAAIYHEAIAAASTETLPGPAPAGTAVEGSVLDHAA